LALLGLRGAGHDGTVFEVRFHGRGGQGAVTAADLLALAAFEEGRYAQSFPSFGSERMGAPVVAYCRLGEREIRTREPVLAPDCVIVIDPTLVHQVDLFAGLGPEGYLLVNSSRPLDELGLSSLAARFRPERLCTVPATEVALRQIGKPLPNAAMLGGFAALTAEVTIAAISSAIRERFSGNPSVAERNVAAVAEVYQLARQVTTPNGRAMLGAPAD
jgi:pyruvate ferredoxin oxidoreductase gamma subunit